MIKRLWFLAIFGLFLVICPVRAQAQEQFLTSYDVNYDVGADGLTIVNEAVTFKNTTDKFYASKYTVSIGATKITDVQAFDKKGSLPTNVTIEDNRTKIEVSFTDQIVGLDKEYTWNLRYKSSDYAERQGKVWQVTIPRAPKLLSGDEFNLNVSVPVSFGDPTSIDPRPTRKVESGGKIRMYFDKTSLDQRGILASFGSIQVMDFDIKYVLRNDSVLPVYGKVPLPMDTNYQQVLIQELNPKPENVTRDDDGNYIAWYKLDRETVLSIGVEGMVKLVLKGSSMPGKELSRFEINRLTRPDKYWEVDNPLIKQRLAEILKDANQSSVRDKAKLIDKFVVNSLSYDQARVNREDFERFGAVSALNNPTKALCGEYADLFVTLARAAGIPARRLEGYAYTSNQQIRPLSLGRTLLHAWAEYYDSVKGWVMVDPTWESSNDGVDYFNSFDLNHFVLAVEGGDSTQPSASGEIKATVSDTSFTPVKSNNLDIVAPDVVLSGLPAKVQIRVTNTGNVFLGADEIRVKSDSVGELESNVFKTTTVPPFGYFEVETRLRPKSFLAKIDGIIEASFGGVLAEKKVELRPFYEYKIIFGLAVGSIVLMVGVYILSLYLHVRSQKNSKLKLKKDATKVYQSEQTT